MTLRALMKRTMDLIPDEVVQQLFDGLTPLYTIHNEKWKFDSETGKFVKDEQVTDCIPELIKGVTLGTDED